MRAAQLERPPRIHLVEDNPADVELVREALSEGRVRGELSTSADAQEALA